MRASWLLLVLLPLAGCSSDGSDAGSTSGTLENCDGLSTVYGRAAGANGSCVADEGAAVAVACGTPESGADAASVCVEKDGTKYWGRSQGSYELLVGFTACTDPEPRLCSLASCVATKRNYSSTCTLADTKIEWNCGGDSDLDENCCARMECETNENCGQGEHCEQVSSIAYRSCFVTELGSCGCGGTLGGPGAMVCVPD